MRASRTSFMNLMSHYEIMRWDYQQYSTAMYVYNRSRTPARSNCSAVVAFVKQLSDSYDPMPRFDSDCRLPHRLGRVQPVLHGTGACPGQGVDGISIPWAASTLASLWTFVIWNSEEDISGSLRIYFGHIQTKIKFKRNFFGTKRGRMWVDSRLVKK